MLNSGFSHLCHHTIHWEWCTDYAGRVEYIRENKPAEEVEPRLKWFAIIPDDRLPLALVTAWGAYSKARTAYNEMRGAYSEARGAYSEARGAYSEAQTAYDKALAAAAPELAVLHDELFPDCPWNEEQRTMFPDGEEK